MLTTYELSQLAATADAIIWELEQEREVNIERMFVLLDKFRAELPDPPLFAHRGYEFALVPGDAGQEGIQITRPAPSPNSPA